MNARPVGELALDMLKALAVRVHGPAGSPEATEALADLRALLAERGALRHEVGEMRRSIERLDASRIEQTEAKTLAWGREERLKARIESLKAALEASRADAARLADALDEASCCRVLLSNHALAGSDWFPARQEASAQKTYAALSAHRALSGGAL